MEKKKVPNPLPPAVQQDKPRIIIALIAVLGVSLSLFQMYIAGINPLGLFYQRSIHLAGVMMLAFLVFPPFKGHQRGVLGWAVDLAFFAAAGYSAFYLLYNLDEIFDRAGFWTEMDIWVGMMTIVVLLEACHPNGCHATTHSSATGF